MGLRSMLFRAALHAEVRAVSAVVGEEPGSRPARVLAPAALAPRPSGSCSGRRARLDGCTVYTPRVA